MYHDARMRMNVHLGACRQILAQADLCIIFFWGTQMETGAREIPSLTTANIPRIIERL